MWVFWRRFVLLLITKTKKMLWYKIKEKPPIAYEKGCWNGLRSDKILVGTRSHGLHIVRMYECILHGKKFCDFYDDRDFEIDNVILWAEIDDPF